MATHCYVRASTNKQKESPEVQREIIKKYCLCNNLDEPQWYVDEATTAKVMIRDREAGSMLARNLRKGDHVVIAKLDRAFRRLRDCVVMMDEFERIGVHLHVCNLLGGAIDLSLPVGRFMIQILAAFAELERAFISERISDTARKLKREGRGGGLAHYGFKHEKRAFEVNGKQVYRMAEVPDTYERAIMKMIAKWRIEGKTWDWMRQEINYNLKLRTTKGNEWSTMRIVRACKAEMLLQYKEMENRASEPNNRDSR